MALIKSVRGFEPKIPTSCWLAENSTIIGEVTMGKGCSIWFNTVIRGDVNSITVGEMTNIQDNATIHGTYQKAATYIGNRVSIGHNAVVHGCTIEDWVLVGMGSILMDHAYIKTGSIIAAGSVVTYNTIVEENMVYAGIPAKPLKPVDPSHREMMENISKNYLKYASWFQD